jgi:hypothetical protein
MMRWLEEFELKHAEFIRCIKSFHAMATAWSTLATTETREGYAAFARYQADIYGRLHRDAEDLFKKNAEPSLYESRDNLIEGIQKLRRRELAWLWRMAGASQGVESESEAESAGKGKRREREKDDVDDMDVV